VAAVLLVLLVVAMAAGWVGWLGRYPGQTWQWVTKRWLASSALAVIVVALGVWGAWAGPRGQQRRIEARGDAQQAKADAEQAEAADAEQAEAEARRVAERQAAWEQRCRSVLACWPLPKVEDVDPFKIGVFYSRRAEGYRGDRPRPPYVPRGLDRELARLLGVESLVLVKGQSRAGKSRTAFEVAARELAGWRLLVPKDRAALAVLTDLDPLPGQGVQVLVWLDDLDEYLAVEGAHGLDAGLLGRWAACDPPVKVLATIRLEAYGRLAATPGELGRSVRELLNRFDPGAITLSVGFDGPDEQAAIAELYPGEQVSGGLAEHLAAAHELVDRFEVGQASVPEGAGLVLAAVDCRRAGLDRPVAKTDLAALLPLYLEQLRPLTPFHDGDVDRGLGWASEPVGRTAALLVADPDPLAGTFRVADPIVDYVERCGSRKLAQRAVWEHLVARVSVEEALDMALAAYSRGEPSAVQALLQRVIDSGDSEQAPAAAFNLGVLLTQQGDPDGAAVAYQHAIDSGHHHLAPKAAVNLGVLLARQGDPDGAAVAYQRAIDSGHLPQASTAALNLGLLLAEHGDPDGACAAFQRAIDSGHPDAAPSAAVNLGLLHQQQGDSHGARAAYQHAINSGHHDEAPGAAVNLGLLLAEQGEVAGARVAYQQAIDSGHHDHAAAAARNLGVLLERQGDPDGAAVAYQRAIDSGHPDAAPKAAVNLGLLHQRQGDPDGAAVAFQRAIDSGHPDAAPSAAVNLGVLLRQQGDPDGARAAFQQAIDSGHPDAAPKAAFNLGVLLAEKGNLAGARVAFKRAIDSGHPEVAAVARDVLGKLDEQSAQR